MGLFCLIGLACLWPVLSYETEALSDQCECFFADGFTNKCHCEGNITAIKEKVQDTDLYSLSISTIKMVRLQGYLFEDYKNTLVELIITSSNSLEIVDSEVFDGMTNLKLLRITHTSLGAFPELMGLGAESSMHIIDLESNKIRGINSNSAKVRTEQFFLDYNQISYVDGWAFNGSEIAKLSLKGNIELSKLAADAFNGIENLRDLDLSDTSITFLPVLGLEGLEILRLTNTFSLKVIPSIYDLNNLQNAWLTYSFHCCAFHNPEKHDPFRHQEYLKLKKKLCPNERIRSKRHMKGGFGSILENKDQGYGCKISGFLTVFASQLSLFTLSLLTVERWFAIRHALYLNMLDLKFTWNMMAIGWIYSIIMAFLPLIGVSSYSTTSICLPMDSRNAISQGYIITMILVAGCAFLLMCICYTQIYYSLSYETRNSISEGAIARKMTLLVGTNFICWAPVAFFSITALAGYPLITISQSKILLVFIYPINSCANPYLYAILTKQFRKDFKAILSRYVLHKRWTNYNTGYSRPVSNEVPGQPTTAETLL